MAVQVATAHACSAMSNVDGIYLRDALDVNAGILRSTELGYCQVSREVVVLLSVKQACLLKSGPYGPRHSAQLGEPHILGNINEEHLRNGAAQLIWRWYVKDRPAWPQRA